MSTNLILCLTVCITSPGQASAEKADLVSAHDKFVQSVEHFSAMLSDLPKPLARDWKKSADGFEKCKQFTAMLSSYQQRGDKEFTKVREAFIAFRRTLERDHQNYLRLAQKAQADQDEDEAKEYQYSAYLYQEALDGYDKIWKKLTRHLPVFLASRGSLERSQKGAPAFGAFVSMVNLFCGHEQRDFETMIQNMSLLAADGLNRTVAHFREFATDVRAVATELRPPRSR
jgi:hypothetical protein